MKFLRWWLIVVLTSVGLTFFVINGGFEYVNQADFTKITFLIFGLFTYCTIRMGAVTYRGYGDDTFPKFCVGLMTKLGMTGTVLGFMKMLSVALSDVNVQDVKCMQSVLSQMSHGMSTALVTTAAGLIASILLQIQVYNNES